MDKNNKDILKKGLHETKMDFTANLMDKVQAEEKALSSILAKASSLETSKDFTGDLMLKLEGKVPIKPYAPVITKSAWMVISAVFSAIILVAIIANGEESGSFKYDLKVEQFSNGVTSVFQYIQVITYACFGIFVLMLGLLIEHRYKKTS